MHPSHLNIKSRMNRKSSKKHVLIVTAVDREQNAVLQGLDTDDPFDVLAAGVGPIAAAASTSSALAIQEYRAVISMGIGGGFVDTAKVGDLIVATELVAAELGAETETGFLSVDQLELGSSRIQCDPSQVKRLVDALNRTKYPVVTGPILTVSTVTGRESTAQERIAQVPGATAEAMEGFGVAVAAQMYQLPVFEIRSISNAVGPRDRSSWKMKEAFERLTEASRFLKEVF